MLAAGDAPPTAAVRGAPQGGGARSEAGCSFLLAAIGVLLAVRIPILFVRGFDKDEFEHAHAAWNVFKGMLPYKDFFEHHTPWYYFTLQPFFRWFGVDQSFAEARHFLIAGRVLSLAMTAAAALLVFFVARLGATRRVGLWATLFFVGQPVLIHKTLEIRPDVPALLFFVGALWFLRHGLAGHENERRPPRDLRWFLGGGLCLGAAIMCTQKLLFAVPGTALGLVLWTWAGRRADWRFRIGAVLVVGLAIAAPGLLTWGAFALHGGGRQFIYNNFLLNAHWQWRSGRHVVNVLRTSWPILLLFVAGAWNALVRRDQSEPIDHGNVLLLCMFGGLTAGIAVVPAAYEQYYLPVLAIACVVAASGLALLLQRWRPAASAGAIVCATFPFLIWPVVDLGRAFARREPIQTTRLQFVFSHTSPSDPVLDGFLGTNVFRPQPSYYFFMHRELLSSLSDAQKDAYVDELINGPRRPALIVMDDEIRELGPRFMRFLQTNYASSDGLFYLPRPR